LTPTRVAVADGSSRTESCQFWGAQGKGIGCRSWPLASRPKSDGLQAAGRVGDTRPNLWTICPEVADRPLPSLCQVLVSTAPPIDGLRGASGAHQGANSPMKGRSTFRGGLDPCGPFRSPSIASAVPRARFLRGALCPVLASRQVSGNVRPARCWQPGSRCSRSRWTTS
jgi:hypothetical protein